MNKTAFGVALAVALAPAGAAAHALDEYQQAARLSLTRTDVRVEIDLTPGVEIAASIVRMMDANQDGRIAPAEAAAYGVRVLSDIVVALDDEQIAMTLTRIEVPPVGEMQDGLGTIRLNAVGAHHAWLDRETVLSFRNGHAPDTSVYSVNGLLPADRTFSLLRQDRDVEQRSVRVFYDVGTSPDLQMGWVLFAIASCVGLIRARRPGVSIARTLSRLTVVRR